jgi:hypothetical protein
MLSTCSEWPIRFHSALHIQLTCQVNLNILAVKLLLHSNVTESNLGRDERYSEICSGCTHSLFANAGTVLPAI